MHNFPWPLLVVNLSITGLIWRGTAYFVQNILTQLLSYLAILDELRVSLPCKAPVTDFWRQNRSLETQNGSYFSILPTSLVFEMINPFSWIFNDISSDKSCLISTWRQDTKIFHACWILIGQFKFPARQPYARFHFERVWADHDRALFLIMFRIITFQSWFAQYTVWCFVHDHTNHAGPRAWNLVPGA